jgi:CRP-like cAMP-binding protein
VVEIDLKLNCEVADMAIKAKSALFDSGVLFATDRGRSLSEHLPGQIIFTQGGDADSVFHIVRGKVKVAVISDRGREAVLGLLGDGDFFGEGCLIGQSLRLSTAVAMTHASVMRIEKAEMIHLLHAEPDFAQAFTAHLLTRNSRIEADIVDYLFNSIEMRLARALLLLANFGKEGTPEPVIAKITQETLAEMIGTTRPRVNFFMNKFKKLGFIEYNGTLRVHSSLLSVILRQ